jgi:hypothetical protein
MDPAHASNFEAILDRVDDINKIVASSVEQEDKNAQILEVLASLSPEELRKYRELINFDKYQSKKRGKTAFNQPDKSKVVAMEFSPLNQEYTHQLMFLGNIHYTLDRLKDYKCSTSDRIKLLEFIDHCFGVKEDHVGSMFDMFYAKERCQNPTYIPELPEPFLTKIKPSFEQWINAFGYVKGHFESLRMATTALFGSRPTQEARVYIHGVFDDEAALDKYRLQHASNIMDILYVAEIGKETCFDPYRSVRNNCVVYDPTDKEIELLFRNKSAATAVQENAMKNRLRRGKDSFVAPADLANIRKLTAGIKKLDTIPQTDEVVAYKQELAAELQNELASQSAEGEVIVQATNLTTSSVDNVFIDRGDLELS